jgi:peptidoglycan/xylan/chitin deacetylase (PgdA/CDA1 family)
MARRAVRKGIGSVGAGADRLIPACRTALTRGLTVFIFHDITSAPSGHQCASGSYTTPRAFEEQLRWITRRFTVVAPHWLPQLGGDRPLPANAALITFDDSWAGVFRTGVPILRKAGTPALCFLNMGTVAGDPDVAAVRRYEALNPPPDGPHLERPLDLAAAERVLRVIRERYGDDERFADFQGVTATPDDLDAVADSDVWLGSHLYHHWDLRQASASLYKDSFDKNAAALGRYPNVLPAFATPHGFGGDERTDVLRIPLNSGARVVFTGLGNQNACAEGQVLDRVSFPLEPTSEADLWYATHRRRVVGSLAS